MQQKSQTTSAVDFIGVDQPLPIFAKSCTHLFGSHFEYIVRHHALNSNFFVNYAYTQEEQ